MTGATNDLDLDIQIERERLRLGAQPSAPPAIDTTTGAPFTTRVSVGAAVKPEDRLSTLRKQFPDAQPYGKDNFVYTNPQTGKPTLYNEEGPSLFGMRMPTLGDVGSVLPEIGEFAGGIVGGGMGVAAMPTTGGASALTIPVMTGLGATAGKELVQQTANWFMGTDDTRTVPERAVDQATTTGVNAVAGPAADLATKGVRAVIGPVRNTAAEAFERLQVPPMAGAVTGNKMVQSAEQAAFNSPGGTGTMQKAFEETTQGVQTAAKNIAEDIANTHRQANQSLVKPKSQEDAGTVLKNAADKAGTRFANTRQVIDDTLVNLVGADRPTQLGEVQALLTRLQADAAKAPTSSTEFKRAIAEAERMVNDAATAGGSLPFDVVRRLRTRIGRELEQPDASGYLPGEDRYMRNLYGALVKDIETAAASAGPRATQALKIHDRYVRMFRGTDRGRIPPAETLTKVLQSGSDAKAMRYALEDAENSTQRLWQLRRSVTPEEWDVISASVFDSLGRAKPGAQGGSMLGDVSDDFSIGTFPANWEKLGKSGREGRTSRDVLFGGSRYGHVAGAINDLATVVSRLKDSQKMANTSGTARSSAWNGLFAGLGGGLGAIGTGTVLGTVGSAALGAGGHIAVGYGAAQLLTSPRFLRWLTNSARAVGSNPNAMIPALARLTAIAKAEPELAEAIHAYRNRVELAGDPNAA